MTKIGEDAFGTEMHLNEGDGIPLPENVKAASKSEPIESQLAFRKTARLADAIAHRAERDDEIERAFMEIGDKLEQIQYAMRALAEAVGGSKHAIKAFPE